LKQLRQAGTADRGGDLEPLLQIRKPLQHASFPYVLCWSQKAGSTSLLKWFLHHCGLLADAREYGERDFDVELHRYENEVLKRQPGYQKELQRRLADPDTPVIHFVRCPYSRVFSMYMHVHKRFFINLEKKGIASAGIRTRKEILRFVYGGPVSLENTFSFEDFLEWLQFQDLSAIDPHFRSQQNPLFDHVPVQHYRLNDFSAVVEHLERRAGLPQSRGSEALRPSLHHLNTAALDDPVTLRMLRRGFPLSISPAWVVPRVDRRMLEMAGYGAAIERLFRDDIELYESLEPFHPGADPA
jgi:hypothetical protein